MELSTRLIRTRFIWSGSSLSDGRSAASRRSMVTPGNRPSFPLGMGSVGLWIGQSVAVVVGSLLNLINQGDAILRGAEVDWLKLALTYCVPFCVALYGAYSANRTRLRG